MMNQVCGGTLALMARDAATAPTAGPADVAATVPPAVAAEDVVAVAGARLVVDWHPSMTVHFDSRAALVTMQECRHSSRCTFIMKGNGLFHLPRNLGGASI